MAPESRCDRPDSTDPQMLEFQRRLAVFNGGLAVCGRVTSDVDYIVSCRIGSKSLNVF